MLGWIGFWEILLVLGLLLLFFGGRRIPRIARGLGLGIRNFKGEMKEGDPEEGGELSDRSRSGARDAGSDRRPDGS